MAITTASELNRWLMQPSKQANVKVVVMDVCFDGVDAKVIYDGAGPSLHGAPVVLATNGTPDQLAQAVRGLRTFATDILIDPNDDGDIDAIMAAAGTAPRRSFSCQASLGKAVHQLSSEGDNAVRHVDGQLDWGPVQQNERRLIIEALEQTGGHVCRAAKLLRLGQATVYRKIQRYKISRASSHHALRNGRHAPVAASESRSPSAG
ncbi:helix-turn-helix domain-containing protein [Botrimarina colliarenosi]|uniref:helix-turn-helix domain-containing protein n=1 Tax=Botrimarina colliarenosi TaxID=2528001 RepID=UPI0011B8412C|nr:helix-turn-helix domain-containing protein [Botrimarina colliarenosi]